MSTVCYCGQPECAIRQWDPPSCRDAEFQRLRIQRDELAEALRRLARAYEKVTGRESTPLLNQANAALAKLEVKP